MTELARLFRHASLPQELVPYDRAAETIKHTNRRLHEGVANSKIRNKLQSGVEVLQEMMNAVASQPDEWVNGIRVRRKVTAYSRRHIMARLSAARSSYMYLPNIFRQSLGRKLLRDFDFVKSFQRVAVGLLMMIPDVDMEDFSALVAYSNDDANELLGCIVAYYGFYCRPKECAKVMLQVAFFHGCLSANARAISGFQGLPMPELEALREQCLRARDAILAMPCFADAIPKLHKSVRRQKPGRTEEQYLRSVFSHILGGVEGHCLSVACQVLEEHGFAPRTYIYDGANTTDSSTHSPQEACDAADAAVLAKTGIRMTLREKPMFDCNELNLYADTLEALVESVRPDAECGDPANPANPAVSVA